MATRTATGTHTTCLDCRIPMIVGEHGWPICPECWEARSQESCGRLQPWDIDPAYATGTLGTAAMFGLDSDPEEGDDMAPGCRRIAAKPGCP